jgi:hypothetical protein
MQEITVAQESNKLFVTCPEHSDFARRAEDLSGVWLAVSQCWMFDPSDEARGCALLLDCFGSDGTTAPEDLLEAPEVVGHDELGFPIYRGLDLDRPHCDGTEYCREHNPGGRLA